MSIISSISANPLAIGFIILCLAVLVLLGLVVWLYMKLRRFLVGFDSKNIGDSLVSVSVGLKDLQAFRKDLEGYLTTVEKRLKKSVQSINTVRFNPFKGTGGGGNQSFSTAFLNEEGDGVVISSLYSRERVSVFSKPIKGSESEYELTEEETAAVNGNK